MSFVELYINGEYRGIYTNTESVDDELNEHYGDNNNPFLSGPGTFDLGAIIQIWRICQIQWTMRSMT